LPRTDTDDMSVSQEATLSYRRPDNRGRACSLEFNGTEGRKVNEVDGCARDLIYPIFRVFRAFRSGK